MFLRKLSEERKRFRRQYSQYWLDAMVEQLQRQAPQSALSITGKVIAVLQNERLGAELIVPGINIVTNAGDLYYAQSALGETPAVDFAGGSAGLRLGDDNTTPTKADTDVTSFLAGTGKALTATYPKTDDDDTDNTGADVDIATWLYSYTTAQGNSTGIIEGAIVNDITTPTAALTHFLFAALFDKTSSDTLKVFANHEFLGS